MKPSLYLIKSDSCRQRLVWAKDVPEAVDKFKKQALKDDIRGCRTYESTRITTVHLVNGADEIIE